MASTFPASVIGRVCRQGASIGRLLAGLLCVTVSGAGATALTPADVAQARAALEGRVSVVREGIQVIGSDEADARDKQIVQWLNWPNWPNWNNWNNWRNFNWFNR
jgi:hypothetical protein